MGHEQNCAKRRGGGYCDCPLRILDPARALAGTLRPYQGRHALPYRELRELETYNQYAYWYVPRHRRPV